MNRLKYLNKKNEYVSISKPICSVYSKISVPTKNVHVIYITLLNRLSMKKLLLLFISHKRLLDIIQILSSTKKNL